MQTSSLQLIQVIVLLFLSFELYQCYSFEVPANPGLFSAPSPRPGRSVSASNPRINPAEDSVISSTPTPPIPSTRPPSDHVIEVQPSSTSQENSSTTVACQGTSCLKEILDGPDDHAVQRTFLVLGGLAVIVVGYLAIKFVCVKKRRRVDDAESRYGLVETSEMDLLDDDEEDDEDDTLFDLHSHRRT